MSFAEKYGLAQLRRNEQRAKMLRSSGLTETKLDKRAMKRLKAFGR